MEADSAGPWNAPTGSPANLTSWRVRVFAATWASYAGFYFCRKPFYIAKASLEETMNWDAATLGWIGTAYLLAYTLGQFLSGWAGNRFGPRLLLLTGMAVTIGANIAFGFTTNAYTFAAFMVVNGLAQSTGWSNNVGTMARWFHRQERGTVMGWWATNFQVGGVLANLLAAAILAAWGVEWAFFSGSFVLMAVWAFFLFNQRNDPADVGLPPVVDPDESESEEGQDAGWTRAVVTNVLIVGVFYFFVKFIRYALWSWAPYLLSRNYGLDFDDAGYLSTAFDLAGIAGVIVCGWLSDRYFEGRRASVAFLFICGMAASCGFLYVLGPTSLILFGTSLALIGFTLYGPDALMSGAGAIDVGSPQKAVLAAGIINGMGSIGAVVQEFALGAMLQDGGVGMVFGTLLGSSLGAALCLGYLVWRSRTGSADI